MIYEEFKTRVFESLTVPGKPVDLIGLEQVMQAYKVLLEAVREVPSSSENPVRFLSTASEALDDRMMNSLAVRYKERPMRIFVLDDVAETKARLPSEEWVGKNIGKVEFGVNVERNRTRGDKFPHFMLIEDSCVVANPHPYTDGPQSNPEAVRGVAFRLPYRDFGIFTRVAREVFDELYPCKPRIVNSKISANFKADSCRICY